MELAHSGEANNVVQPSKLDKVKVLIVLFFFKVQSNIDLIFDHILMDCLQDYVSITAGFITFTFSLLFGLVDRLLAVSFGATETLSLRLLLYLSLLAATPLYWIHKNEKIKTFVKTTFEYKHQDQGK